MPFVVASTTIDKIQNTHIGNKPPIVPTTGQLWNDTTQQPPLLKMWNGTDWELVHTSIKQLDPVAFEDINKMIDDAISGAEQDRNKIQEAIDKANDALKQAGLNDAEITAIKQIQSEDGKKINQIQVNYNGLQQSVKDLDSKTESYHIQLSDQITDVVKEQGNLSQQIQTAEGNISSVQDSQNNMNRELQTAKETIQQISSKTQSNTELINTVKQTSDSNSQKIVDTSGKVSVVEQTLNEQKQTIIDTTGKINQAVQDIDSANRTISNIDGRVSQVEQKADGITTTVSRVETELNDKANTSYVDNKVNSIQIGGTNLIPNTAPMPTLVSWPATNDSVLENGWQKFSDNITGREVLPKDDNAYRIQLENGMDIVQSILAQTDGEIQSAQFTFFDNAHHYSSAIIKKISEENGVKTYLLWSQYKTVGTNFRTIDLGVINYTGTYIRFKNPMIESGNIPTSWSPAPQDKANQSDVNSINQQLQSQQTQINQKPDRTEIIASSNENPRAYFKVGTFSDGPNAGRGYVSVGADYGFFLSTNTFISDGFTLSANNISAGSIYGNKLNWADDVDTPSYFKDNDGKATKPILNLKVGGTTNDEFYLAGVSSERSLIENDSRYSIIGTSYSQSQISFKNLDWQKGKENNDTLHQSQSGYIKGKYSPVNKECTGIELRSGGSALVIEDVYARDQLNTTNEFAKYVQVGKDADGYPCLSTPSIYTDYIMSSKGEANKGITFYDRLNLKEGIYSAWENNGRKTFIDFPPENGGDTITFHTAEGEGAYGDWHSYFKMINGNWSTGGVANQHHAIVVGGDGYILSFSNEEGDNTQGNANATLVASRYVTNSTRKLKEDIKPIDNIEQAAQDILNIEPKQYLYRDQAEKIKQWKESGKPADEFKHIDTRINIGLIAEDLDEYESLQPFIEKVSDEEGNEGILGIDYSKLTPLLLAVCRRQDDKINELEERLVRMELLMKDLRK